MNLNNEINESQNISNVIVKIIKIILNCLHVDIILSLFRFNFSLVLNTKSNPLNRIKLLFLEYVLNRIYLRGIQNIPVEYKE